MTEAMPFLQKYDITFLRPLPICSGVFLPSCAGGAPRGTIPLMIPAEYRSSSHAWRQI